MNYLNIERNTKLQSLYTYSSTYVCALMAQEFLEKCRCKVDLFLILQQGRTQKFVWDWPENDCLQISRDSRSEDLLFFGDQYSQCYIREDLFVTVTSIMAENNIKRYSEEGARIGAPFLTSLLTIVQISSSSQKSRLPTPLIITTLREKALVFQTLWGRISPSCTGGHH